MSFIIPAQELNFLINKIQNVISAKPTMPILSNVLIEIKAGILKMTATDLTVGISCETEVKMLAEGAVALPAKKLGQLVRELTSPQVQVNIHDNYSVEIQSGTSKFKIHGMSPVEFPHLPDISDSSSFKIPQKTLKTLFHSVAFAIARDPNRYVLTGALMRVANGQVTILGTDGKRLARVHSPVEIDPSFSGSYVIPLKAIDEFNNNLTDEGQAKVHLMLDKMAVEVEGTYMITKLLAGEYPDVSRVIPETSEFMVTLHREELMSLLRQVALFTANANHSVRFSFSDGNLSLAANTSEIGEGKVNMPVNYQGPKLDIAFNPGYFLDILRHSDGEETVAIGLSDSFNPGTITKSEAALAQSLTASPLFVIMPMRLSEE
jgi:DNA polymerase-3 subunit beta